MSDNHNSHVNYLAVFIALCVFTGISVLTDLVHIPNKAVLAVIVLAVASAKALCVMAFFMHLKFEGRWKYVLLAPTTILAIGLPLALLPDVGVHYYMIDVPQVEAGETETSHSSPSAEDADKHGDSHSSEHEAAETHH
ncbi:MAG: cytochrome C oxidase subunit IV family protein [Planctomycetota bacterium]|nr:cytochrome C oxidase subunit IV family protein [Planctomycetota bacterium]MDA1211824.1 cytochrome C oxidase subunit IV family protein [Planctomycetota bacterium]